MALRFYCISRTWVILNLLFLTSCARSYSLQNEIFSLLCRPSTMASRLCVCHSLLTSPRMLTELWLR